MAGGNLAEVRHEEERGQTPLATRIIWQAMQAIHRVSTWGLTLSPS